VASRAAPTALADGTETKIVVVDEVANCTGHRIAAKQAVTRTILTLRQTRNCGIDP